MVTWKAKFKDLTYCGAMKILHEQNHEKPKQRIDGEIQKYIQKANNSLKQNILYARACKKREYLEFLKFKFRCI